MKIGILGGGQLGRMLVQNAIKYDDEWFTLDPDPGAPCATISQQTIGDFKDFQTVIDFGSNKDVVSIEIEHANADALQQLENNGVTVIPSANTVRIIQHKILQKKFYAEHDIPTPDFQVIDKASDLNFPFPFVQKLDTGGYDGRGVQVIKDEHDLINLWNEPSVLETLVDIDKELSIIITKNKDGAVCQFPVTEMVADAKLNLLDFNICPANISTGVQEQINKIAEKFISAINSAGFFAIELFLDKNGKVWVNETAPRLHNSGHQSQEGNHNSQFEQFYRVLKNLPPADVDSTGFSGMLNLIGAEGSEGEVSYEGLEDVMKLPQTYIHLYGKKLTKPGRKMGHINVLGRSREEVIEKLSAIKNKIKVISKN